MSLPSRHYAILSEHVYRPAAAYGHDALRIDGVTYAVVQRVDRPSGYQGAIYRRADTGEYVVAHRGSEFLREPDKDGAGADLAMIGQRINPQSEDAIALTRQALMLARASEPPAPVSVAGHSLGGCLAQIAAHRFGLRGETFNAYGAASLAYGIAEGGNQVLNHVMAGDVVSAGGKHFGRVRMYAQAQEVWRLHEIGRYEDHGGALDLRYPLPAAAALLDSHRMHHFLDGGADGRSRSVLDDPQARYRAQAHQPMFERYRHDIWLLRESVSLTAAALRGAGGIAGELGRLAPAPPPRSPFADPAAHAAPARQTPAAEAPSHDPRRRSHPDHALYRSIRDGVSQLPAHSGAAGDEAVFERTAASLYALAKREGLQRIDRVLSARDGDALFLVEGDPRDPAHRRGQLSAAQAARTPLDESFAAAATAAQTALDRDSPRALGRTA
ncbi:XVIPCD domain-containing protein [Lysobacter firmicutimachus]|uniref:XVIPCD domain-containing protein n=1 Tax=Lysobacter firmicutimachus TaxID=1792846 RepID=A0AAU8N0E7_9GAMM